MKIVFTVLTVLFTLNTFAQIFTPLSPSQIPQGTPPKVTLPPVESSSLFAGKRVAILASHGVEESEIAFPYTYLTQRGALVDVLVPNWTSAGIVASRFLMPSLFVKATATFTQGLNIKYDLMVLTGGAWNAQVVRSDNDALGLIRHHIAMQLPLAAICAGSSVLINAGLTKGVTLTGSPVIKQDLVNAGANYQDQPLVISGRLATSRSPDDLEYFVKGLRLLLIGR